MRRREFLHVLGGVLGGAATVWLLAARAQPVFADTIPRIGFIGTAPGTTPFEVFQDSLRQLGWIEGQTIRIEYRWAQGQVDQAALRAAELVQLKPVLITVTASQYIDPVRQVDGTIPVVFCTHGDPIGAGHVASLARPGGN